MNDKRFRPIWYFPSGNYLHRNTTWRPCGNSHIAFSLTAITNGPPELDILNCVSGVLNSRTGYAFCVAPVYHLLLDLFVVYLMTLIQ